MARDSSSMQAKYDTFGGSLFTTAPLPHKYSGFTDLSVRTIGVFLKLILRQPQEVEASAAVPCFLLMGIWFLV
jgi:hypothetical protein